MRRSTDALHDPSPRRPLRRTALRLAAVATAVLLAAGATTAASGQSASATASALACDQNTIYGIDSGHHLKAIDVASGTTTAVKDLTSNTNALAVSVGGSHAYAFSTGGGANGALNTLEDYDASTDTVTPVTGVDTGGTAAIRGAVNPATGIYYYAAATVQNGSTFTSYIGAYDPATGTRLGQVGSVVLGASGGTGDMAFSKSGVLYFLAGEYLYRVDSAIPTTSGTAPLTTTQVTHLPAGTASPGLAFAANGYLYISTGTALSRVDPTTGTLGGSALTMSASFSPNDLAGCNNPDSLAASVSVPERVHASDQWTVTLGGGSTWSAASKTATTSGTATGVQSQTAGPVLALGGGAYTATQTMPSGSASDYTTTWACRYRDDSGGSTLLDSGTGSTASVHLPTGASPNGLDLDCRFTNTPRTATVGLTIALGGIRTDASDQFALGVHLLTPSGTAAASTTTAGSGSAFTGGSDATGTATVIASRPVVLTADTASGSASAFSEYGTTITCTDPNGQTGLPNAGAFTGSYTLTPQPGSAIACVLTASPQSGRVTVGSALGGARVDDGDQLTVVLQGSGGAALGQGTTTGTGSTVTGGSTGTVVVPGGGVLTVQQTASAHDAQYARTLSCTDANARTANLPSGTVFTGSATITPASGSAITCTVTASPRAATVSAATALGAARIDDGDQFALVVRDAGGAVLGGPATTGGSGSAVAGGGVGATAVTGGAAITIAQAPTAHAARYSRTLTCTDANGFTAGLPTGAAFTGSASIVPAAGAAISCTVATRPATAALTLAISGPASLTAGKAAEYALTVGNDGGSAVAPTVAQRLPAGVAYTGVTGTGWSCTASGTVAAGQLVTCSGPAVAAGADRAYVLKVTPTAAAAGTDVVVPAAVDPTGGSNPAAPASCLGTSAPAGCAVAAAVHVASGVALTVAVTGPTAFVNGVPAQYDVAVTNTGTGAAGSATAQLRLPEGVRYVGVTGATCTADGRLVTCTVPGPIAGGGTVHAVVDVLAVSVEAGSAPVARVTVDASGGTSPAAPAAATCTGADCGTATAAVATPSLTLSAALQGGARTLAAGDVVRYVYTVTNTGAVPLTGIVLSDGTTCAVAQLAPGASTTCTSGPHTVTQQEVDAGGFAQATTASATVAGCTADCATGSNPARVAAVTRTVGTLRLVQSAHLKDADGDGRAGAGETVVFRAVVTNTGTASVAHLKVRGSLGRFTCPKTALEPGESVTCTLAHVVQSGEVKGGVLTDTAIATGSGGAVGAVASAHRTATVTAAALPAALASTGLDLTTPLGAALSLLLLAGLGVVLLRRRAVLRRR